MKLALLQDVLDNYQDKGDRGWETLFRNLRVESNEEIDNLATSIQEEGIKEPIILGEDGYVWEGRSRLCVADMLGIERVPVLFSEDLK
jgi:ParB-like chromosome segregation protein Spo0J